MRRRAATVLGAVALGLAGVAFAWAGEFSQNFFAGLVRIWPWLPIVLTPAGFALVTWATRRFAPAASGSGIPQVMAAARQPQRAATGALVSLRSALVKVAGTLAMLMVGGSVGREGPTVQLSAAVGVAVHRWLRVPITAGVIIAGGAAGIAAAFNTPLAGVAFAIEELAAAFEQKVAVLVMAAVLIAGLVSLGVAGDYVYFGAMSQKLPLASMLVGAPLAGLSGGVAGAAFARTLIAFRASAHPALAAARARPIAFAAACGLMVALVGLASRGLTWGTGYETTRQLLQGTTVSWLFGPGKFLAALATALSGAPGGIFAPSLSVGAGLGQLLGLVFPPQQSGALVLLGMIGFFTGVVRAPLTAVIIVMEMTADRTMILPLFATALIADWTSAGLCRDKLYHALSLGFADR
ncbi:chloride channel protein [Parablastomonas sp. CN1-191]|uniref:chloride channel protein n=1 Tax=Parablastomonas sp. CN1-191 TaxID=3400908 RepID=UPI003BF8FFA8